MRRIAAILVPPAQRRVYTKGYAGRHRDQCRHDRQLQRRAQLARSACVASRPIMLLTGSPTYWNSENAAKPTTRTKSTA
jgi:hypothetical protein